VITGRQCKRGRVDDIVRVARDDFPNRAAELDPSTKLLVGLENDSNSVKAKQKPSISSAPPSNGVRADSVESHVVSRLTISSHVHRLWGKSYPLYFSATTAPSSDAP